MTPPAKIAAINQAVHSYFNTNKDVEQVLAKDLMPLFISKGIFETDRKGGLPIREVLRKLDSRKELHLIPSVQPMRKQANTNWYFVRAGGNTPVIAKPNAFKPAKKPNAGGRAHSDEAYVIDLCDAVLKLKAQRQHGFDFLLGDAGKSGSRRKLPVDAFYPNLNLVIEYLEPQHSKPVKHFDKPDKITVSGVHRGEQRKIYDERRRTTLPKMGIRLIEIDYTVFNCDGRGRIVRDKSNDLSVISKLILK